MTDTKITFNLDAPIDVETEGEGYLSGHLLVATPTVLGDEFTESVVYMFAHNEYGAMGLVINKPVDVIQYAALVAQLGISARTEDGAMQVMHGGPMEEHRGFVLHEDIYLAEDTVAHGCGLAVTSSLQVLEDISAGKGPAKHLLAVGYAGWGPGQLEAELESGSWICVPATPELVFADDVDAKWGMAAKSLGVDMMRLSAVAGHA